MNIPKEFYTIGKEPVVYTVGECIEQLKRLPNVILIILK